MGAVTGLLGVGGGASGTGYGGPSALPQDSTGMTNLQTSFKQLQDVAAGNGPNPAMAQYNQNVQDLAKQQSGAISSVQGISPALAARLASQQGSAALQNAAAQGATTQAQQQLGAMGQMGGIAGQQASIAAGMQQNVNNVNSSLGQTTMQGQQGMIGGLMNSIGKGSFMAAANGGMVPKMADGGGVGPMSSFTQFLQGQAGANSPVQVQPTQSLPAVSGMSKGLGGYGGQSKGKPGGAPGGIDAGQGMGTVMGGGAGDAGGMGSMAVMAASRGGQVPALLSPGETYIPPGKVNQAAKSQNPLAAGKRVPGKPRVAGNSYANDVVPAKLEAGGVVIPNSIMQSKNPAQGAKDFIADIIAKRKARK